MASSFHVNYADLQRILENIKIAERESAGENLLDIITEVATGSPAITPNSLSMRRIFPWACAMSMAATTS